jgi:hypothetical protein
LAVEAELELVGAPLKLENLKIPDMGSLATLIIATCNRARFASVSEPVSLASSSKRTTVSLSLDPWMLRESVTFELQVVLASDLPRKGLDVILPSRAGSVLWSKSFPYRLEGMASELALRVVSGHHVFSGSPHGLWYVKLVTLDMTLSSDLCVEVLLNQANADVMEMLRDPEAPASRVLRNRLAFDVFRYLAGLGVAEDSTYDPNATYEAGSLGQNINSVLAVFDEDLDRLRYLKRSDEREFDARLQSLIGGTK